MIRGLYRIMLRVGNHNDGCTPFIEVSEQFHYFITIGRIQVSRRFIGQDQFGFVHNRTCYGTSLLLTT